MKKLKVIIAILLTTSMLAACGGAGANEDQVDPSDDVGTEEDVQDDVADGEVVNLRHWVWLDNPNDPTFKEMVEEFNDTHPNIQVDLEVVGWDDYYSKLLTALVGGDAPDTSAFKLTWTPAFTANDGLYPLDDMLATWDGKDDILDNLWDVFDVEEDGKMYLMPWEMQILYMYYRPSLFEEAGVDIPETWDEFVEVAKALTIDTTGDGNADQYGFGMRGARYGHEPWGSFVIGYGAEFLDDEGNVVFNSEEAIEGNEVFLDLYRDGLVPPTAPGDGFSEIIANFEAGRTAMVVHHIKSSPQMVEQFGDDVSAFPVPKGPKGQWTSMGDTENVILGDTEHPEEAFTFISWLAEQDQVDRWSRASGNVPISKSVQELDYYQENRFMQASFDSADFAGVYPIIPAMGEWIETLWPATIQRALEGELTSEEVVEILHNGLEE